MSIVTISAPPNRSVWSNALGSSTVVQVNGVVYVVPMGTSDQPATVTSALTTAGYSVA